MKRLLTTAMVLVMLATMFCASPVVTAAGTPGMEMTVFNSESFDDTISASLTDVGDATWVVWSVKADSTGEYVFVDEKRGNKAEAEGFSFYVAPTEKTALQTTQDFTTEAKITYAGGNVITLTKSFEYNTFAETQTIIRDMLAGTMSIVDATDALVFPRPSYYSSNATVDAAIIASLNTTYAAEIGNVSITIDPETFFSNLVAAMLIESLNTQDTGIITTILDSFYGDVGILITDVEKTWYDASATKASVASRLAGFTYETISDFTNQFKTIAFLDRLAFEPLSNVMNFLETYANNYQNYGSDIHLNGGSTNLTLDFTATGYDKTALSADQQEFAASYMADNYASLDALDTRFAELLINLSSVQTPTPPIYTPPVSTGPSGPSVSVGLVTPIVGENANPFTDIEDVAWAKEAIVALAKEGVIEGVSAKQYQPNANVTREQFVKIIVNTFGLKGTGLVAAFEDVDQNAWYASYINTAVELGIIKGTSDTRFGVEQNISRQDMTLIMYRVAKYVGIDVTAKSGRTFTDANSIDSYAIDAVTALYRAGIVNGVADGVFGGQQTATRAQAAKLCYDLRESK